MQDTVYSDDGSELRIPDDAHLSSFSSSQLDQLFVENPASSQITRQNCIQLESIHAPFESDTGAAKVTPKQTRHCCFLFEGWGDQKETVENQIREKVEFLRTLKRGNGRGGITLINSPTYFLDKEGRGTWVILTSNSTTTSKWSSVGESIGCKEFRPIYATEDRRNGGHAFSSLHSLFGMSLVEIDCLELNRVPCELPEARKRVRQAPPAKDEDEPDSKRQTVEGKENVSQQESKPIPAKTLAVSPAEGSIAELCLKFITSPTGSSTVLEFLRRVTECLSRSEDVPGKGRDFSTFILEGKLNDRFIQLISLQGIVLDILRGSPYNLQIDTLNNVGINLQQDAWRKIRANDKASHTRMVKMLEKSISTMDEAFDNLGFALFDSVSIGFFFAVHVLGKYRGDKSPFFYHVIRDMTQDMRRMTLAIFHLSEFIRTWSQNNEVFAANLLGILAPTGISADDFWMREMPPCMQDFCKDQVHANQKKIRCARFKDMVVRLGKDLVFGDAEGYFNLMQGSIQVFRVLTKSSQIYGYLFHSMTNSDMIQPLFDSMRDTSVLV